MEQILLERVISNGVWAVLSVYLIIMMFKRQSAYDHEYQERENNYREIIDELIQELSKSISKKKD